MGIDASVVIPTFRRPGLLGEAVRSALAQSAVVDLEVIVVDDSAEGSARSEIESLANATVKWVQMRPRSGGRPNRVPPRGSTLRPRATFSSLSGANPAGRGASPSLSRGREGSLPTGR